MFVRIANALHMDLEVGLCVGVGGVSAENDAAMQAAMWSGFIFCSFEPL
jgi:hypothetical protein